jgi:predicted Zn-dependent peptidase
MDAIVKNTLKQKKTISNTAKKATKKTVRKTVPKPSVNRPEFRKVVLPNGVRVLIERHPISRAASCGVWVNKGTRHEMPHEAGLAHFVEHMVFKRTKKRSAYKISRDMEAVGGELNAFTSREYTSFVTHSLKEHVGLSLDVLSDLVCNPLFDPSDIKKEKQVVLQEIQMAEDQLEDNIFDRYFELVYPGVPLGKPILGSVKSIETMKRETILSYHARQFTAPNMIVTVTGNVDPDEVLSLVMKHLKPRKGTAEQLNRRGPDLVPESASGGRAVEAVAFREAIQRPSEQAHVLIGLPAADFRSDLRFEGYVVNSLLGGGMTSRLYQTVREDRGLVYSIYSQLVSFADSGVKLIYAGSDPKRTPLVIDLTLREIKKLRRDGIKKADLDLFKTQVKGQILLGADDIDNRMNSIGVNEMIFGRYRSVDDVIRDVEKVSLDSVHEYIERYIDLDRMGILVMGAVPAEQTRKWLQTL